MAQIIDSTKWKKVSKEKLSKVSDANLPMQTLVKKKKVKFQESFSRVFLHSYKNIFMNLFIYVLSQTPRWKLSLLNKNKPFVFLILGNRKRNSPTD